MRTELRCGRSFVVWAVLAASLVACTAIPTKQDKDLAAVLEAYQRQSTERAAQRQARESQGIRALVVAPAGARHDATVTVDLEEALLLTVLRRVLEGAELPYLLQASVPSSQVTARFERLPVLWALNLLLASQGLTTGIEKGVVVIQAGLPPGPRTPAGQGDVEGSSPRPPSSPDGAPSSPPGPAPSGGSPQPDTPRPTTLEVPLRFLDVASATSLLDNLFPLNLSTGARPVTFGQQPYTNTISLVGPSEEVARSASILRQADREPAHVIIEALVVEIDLDASERLGTDLQNFAAGEISGLTSGFGSAFGQPLTFTFTRGAANVRTFTGLIDILVTQEKARVIARPYMATVSGRRAVMSIARDRYVIVQSPQQGAAITALQAVSSGVLLDITPTVLPDGMVRMDLKVEQSEFKATDPNVAVEVDKNQVATAMLVESGQSVVIGGLALNQLATSNAGLPWLRHIPLLNLVFAK